MKLLISEQQFKLVLNELKVKDHFVERINLRLLDQTFYDVVAFYKHNLSEKTIIGKYKIPDDAKITANRIFNQVKNTEYNIDNDTQLLVKLYEFDINAKYITFIGNNPEEQRRNKEKFYDTRNYNIFLQTPRDEKGRVSYGKILVCILSGTQISTTILIGDSGRFFERFKEVMKETRPYLRHIYFIDDVETQLAAYVDIEKEKAKPIPTDDDNNKTPESLSPEQQSQMTDKERRLLAYNQKMQKKFRKK